MKGALIIIIIPLFWIKGISPNQSKDVHQTPADVLWEMNTEVKLTCKHNINNYDTILWYQRSRGNSSLKLVGFTSYEVTQTVEKPFEGRFSVSGDGEKEAFLHLLNLSQPEDSGHYFCAAFRQTNYEPAYFGGGTKLTVLESNHTVSLPKVKVLRPSDKECEKKGKKYKKKTLVCVVYGFYPDHVNVFWQVDGENVKDGVATDNAALKAGQNYSITSRLTVGLREWLTEGANFTCIVNFYAGNRTVQESDWIIGFDGRVNRDKYLKITNNAKLSYIVLIIKSSIYGVFVVFLVWWLQRSPGKQND